MSKNKKVRTKKIHVDFKVAGTITTTLPKSHKGWRSIGECWDPETGENREYWVKDDPPEKRKRLAGDVVIPDD